MYTTAEVRWFHKGPLPPEIAAWFTGAAQKLEMEAPRVDYYMHVSSDDVSIKLRGGRIEAKRLLRQQEVTRFNASVAGRLELWQKWSFPMQAGDAEEIVTLDGSAWIAVHKERRMRNLWLSQNGEVHAIPRWVHPPRACALELSEVIAGGEMWWSLCFEVIGNQAGLVDTLHQIVTALVAEGGFPALEAASSYGYPYWLRRLQAEYSKYPK